MVRYGNANTREQEKNYDKLQPQVFISIRNDVLGILMMIPAQESDLKPIFRPSSSERKSGIFVSDRSAMLSYALNNDFHTVNQFQDS